MTYRITEILIKFFYYPINNLRSTINDFMKFLDNNLTLITTNRAAFPDFMKNII